MHNVGRLISVVDDDLSVRRALGRLVKVAGYSVETFASAHEFLASSPSDRTAVEGFREIVCASSSTVSRRSAGVRT